MAEEFTPPVDETPSYTPEQQEQYNIDAEGNSLGEEPAAEPTENLILGKFKSVEDLAKSYQELEASQSGKKVESLKASDAENAGATPLTQSLETAGDYFAENGELSDDHYESLDKLGLKKEYVDSYVRGMQAQQEQLRAQLMGVAGGEESYGQMLEWMNENLNADEVEAYDRVMGSGDVEQITMLIQGMSARHKSSGGDGPATQLQGQSVSGIAGFRSKGEIMEAMSDPRYESDSAYREDVTRKMSITPDTVW
jgi:hypothetical protein